MEDQEVRLLFRHARRAQRRSKEEVEIFRRTDRVRTRLTESGIPVVDVCRQIGVSEATYYTWKKKFGDLGVSELKRLKMLEDENTRLKRIVANLTLDKQILQEVVRKSFEGCPAA